MTRRVPQSSQSVPTAHRAEVIERELLSQCATMLEARGRRIEAALLRWLLTALIRSPASVQVGVGSLTDALTSRTVRAGAGKEPITTPLDAKGAAAARSSLCMQLYWLAFAWCVQPMDRSTLV